MKKKRRTIELAPQTAEMFARCVAVLKPPPEADIFFIRSTSRQEQ